MGIYDALEVLCAERQQISQVEHRYALGEDTESKMGKVTLLCVQKASPNQQIKSSPIVFFS